MQIYLDMCCLKRPFDDQSQPRIRLETEAVLMLLALESENIAFIRSAALALENSLNPLPERAAKVSQWLSSGTSWRMMDPANLQNRITELMKLGLKNFDALHVASAEQAGADLFVTADDRLLAALQRMSPKPNFRASSIVECAHEVAQ